MKIRPMNETGAVEVWFSKPMLWPLNIEKWTESNIGAENFLILIETKLDGKIIEFTWSVIPETEIMQTFII